MFGAGGGLLSDGIVLLASFLTSRGLMTASGWEFLS